MFQKVKNEPRVFKAHLIVGGILTELPKSPITSGGLKGTKYSRPFEEGEGENMDAQLRKWGQGFFGVIYRDFLQLF